MSNYPLHTKLSDLISDEESDDDAQTPMNLNVDFSESSCKAIEYRTNLSSESDNLIDSKTYLDCKSDKCPNCEAVAKSNQGKNSSENLEQVDDNMSKRFGLFYQKGARAKIEKDIKAASESVNEAVLPHLKSPNSKTQYAESSFIEARKDKHKENIKRDQSGSSKQGQSASTSTSDESELGTRADPIGESFDVSMAAAVSEAGMSDENTTLKSDGEEKIPAVEETEESEDKAGLPEENSASNEIHNADSAYESTKQNGNADLNEEEDLNDMNDDFTEKEIPPNDVKSDSNEQAVEKTAGSESDSSAKDQNETKTSNSSQSTHNEDNKQKKSSKTSTKKDQIGSRATRSSLLRSKSIPHSDPSSRKGRRESNSSEESEKSYKPVPPPPKDPIPDASSDFKPYEHWQSLKDSQKAEAKNKITARQEFSERYRKHGLPKRPSLPNNPNAPKHHQSMISLASVSTTATTAGQASRSILKPEFNLIGSPSDKYLTPLQQKEKTIKDMQSYISKLEDMISVQGAEIANFQEEKESALQYLAAEKDAEMDEIFQEMKNVEDEKEEVIQKLKMTEKSLEDEKETVANLHASIAKMEIENEEREEKHKRNYFQMYQKGREAQLIEQEEDIVCHAMANPGNAPNKQLVHRLEKTEKQLDKLRQTFRNETYKQAPHLESDSEAQVELLKSAVFYYLTDCQPEINLRTMLSMLNYSEVQKKNIIRHLEKKMK